MDFIDKELKCVDCGKTFVFSAAEQAFFKDRGFKNDPKHCKQCKAQRYGGRWRTETRVKCSECGIDTIVPFKPPRIDRFFVVIAFPIGRSPRLVESLG